MGHVTATDGEAVAVAAGHQHQQFGVGELDALGDGQGAAVDGVESVGGRVAGDAAGTPDAGDEGNLVRGSPDGGQGAGDGGDHAEIAATRTPDGFQVALEIPGLELRGREGFDGVHGEI